MFTEVEQITIPESVEDCYLIFRISVEFDHEKTKIIKKNEKNQTKN